MGKYSLKNIGTAFVNATSAGAKKLKENREYKQSEEYRKKVLDNMDFKLEIMKRKTQAEKIRTEHSKAVQSRQNPSQTKSHPVSNTNQKEIWQEFN